MSDPHLDAIEATLDRWRERGAPQADPARFRRVEALAGRARGLDGPARRLIDAKLKQLIDEFERAWPEADVRADTGDMQPACAAGSPAAGSPAAGSPAAGSPAAGSPAAAASGLAGLLAYLGAHPALDDDAAADARMRMRQQYPELDQLDYFQATWARLSTDLQLRHSQEQVHENAGPLNSNHLVHRALSLMRAQSPGYLHQFLAYLDALSWVDQLSVNGGLAMKPAARGKKPTRGSRPAR